MSLQCRSASNSVLDDRLATVTACSDLDRSFRSKQRDVTLNVREWNQLARWLRDTDRRPADLLFSSITECLLASSLDRRLIEKASSIPDRASDTYDVMTHMQEEGIWILCRADDGFPQRWKKKLGASTPPVIFGAGAPQLIQSRSVSLVGSRYVPKTLADVAYAFGSRIASAGLLVVSGAAKGTDRFGMLGALESQGRSVGVLPGALRRHLLQDDLQRHVTSDHLCLVTHVHPNTGFFVGNAMARNKLIYAQADLTIVLACAENAGGTWAGAVENLNRRIAPIAVWTGEHAPTGNLKLAELGAYSLDSLPEQNDIPKIIRSAHAHFQQVTAGSTGTKPCGEYRV